MPELPEVETVRRGLQPALEGATIAAVHLARAGLRIPFPPRLAARLTGRTVTALGRRAKYLLASLDDGATLIAHLGMSGSFRVEEDTVAASAFAMARSRDPVHDHVRLTTAAGCHVIYNDPRRFGFIDLVDAGGLADDPRLAGLGPEPNANSFGPEHLARAFAGRAAPLKAMLLDQTVVAGLGNIYVAEALFRAGLSPFRAAGSLSADEVAGLALSVREVIAEAIEAGGSTLRDHMRTDGTLGYFQHAFAVYGREGEPCRRAGCTGVVARGRQAGRSTFHCALCQR